MARYRERKKRLIIVLFTKRANVTPQENLKEEGVRMSLVNVDESKVKKVMPLDYREINPNSFDEVYKFLLLNE